MFDLDWIRKLIALVDESELDTLEVSRFGTRIVLSKSPPVSARLSFADAGANPAHIPSGRPELPATAIDGAQAEARAAGAAEDLPTAGTEAGEELLEIHSPMVGTFYRAPAPDAPPYVEIGDRVKAGQTLCILEAMKLMNELESEVTGVVREISVQNADPVEYGQVLFRVAEDGAG
ncbi:MAG: acetyl-CoA carboxylase biotin carboxyl carrier protein [Gemmatimonadales bacterium]